MAKLSLNKDGIKQFLLANGEKFLLGLTAILLLGFFYSALTAKPLDESMSADSIRTASNKVQSDLSNPTWGEQKATLNLPTPLFEQQVDEALKSVAVATYAEAREWIPALFPELKRRADPKIFAVEELQIASGVGILAYQVPQIAAQAAAIAPTTTGTATTAAQPIRIDSNAPLPGADVPQSDPQGKPYVIVTGLVPVDKEIQEYSDRFALSVPPVPDPNKPVPVTTVTPGQQELPQYAVCVVQRREANPANKPEDNWSTISYQKVIADMKTWALAWSGGQDIVDPNYIFPTDDFLPPGADGQQLPLTRLVTMPLPPLMLKDWGLEAAHPKVRLNTPQDVPGQTTTPDPTQSNDFDGGQAPETNGAMKPATAPPAVTAPPPRMAPPMNNFAFGRNEHGDPRDRQGGGYRMQVPSNGYGGGNSYASTAPNPNVSVPYKLFRFVDFTVDPGKTYQYRVRLYLVNPNFGLKAECLQKADTSNEKYLKSPFTEATPPVTVPHLYQILAENVMGGRGAEPRARVNVLALFKAPASLTAAMPSTSSEVWLEGMREIENWTLGSILAIRDEEFKDVVDPAAMEIRTVKATVETDQPMLLDVRNEDPLGSTKSKLPTEMLVVDSAGRLSISNSAVDRFAQDDYNQMKKTATTSSGAVASEHAAPQPAPKTTTTAPVRKGRDEH